ncbi:hypothetical protein E2C01_091041 [Portunus trituberculatus]|uniref:Uncharacterized protein n=1 Tax=Portunus trituberculatus TaxID=210409 RepID=A0A5B7JU06_PORTR|nr:hypothetical protein [Portunus trituberculatus]
MRRGSKRRNNANKDDVKAQPAQVIRTNCKLHSTSQRPFFRTTKRLAPSASPRHSLAAESAWGEKSRVAGRGTTGRGGNEREKGGGKDEQ